MNHSPVLSMKEIVNIFRILVDDNRKFVLTTHVNPDADGLGSELALHRFLKKLRKESVILNHSETPANHAFMDEKHEIKRFDPSTDAGLVLDAERIVRSGHEQSFALAQHGETLRGEQGQKSYYRSPSGSSGLRRLSACRFLIRRPPRRLSTNA